MAEHRAGTRLGRGRMQGGHRAGKKQKPSYLMASVHHLRTVTAENEALRGLHFLSVTQSSHYHAAGSQRYRIQEHSSHQPIVISFQEHRNSLILHLRAYLASRYRLTHSPPPVRSLPLGCIATLTLNHHRHIFGISLREFSAKLSREGSPTLNVRAPSQGLKF